MSKKFGKYKVLEKIAQGAMGEIFLVEDDRKETFALKTLRTNLDASEGSESRARFLREMTLSEKIDHPNIVKNYFHDLDCEQPYMVMEYMEGGTLDAEIIEKKVLEPSVVLKVAIDVCKALHEIHNHEIIHRDVKPANILISENGDFKLSDLGLARMSSAATGGDENLTMSQTALGTPYYIAPEQAIDAKKADIRSDIYSLGATLYYCLTGKRVHEGSSSVHVMMKHMNEEITHPSKIKEGLPENICSVIMKMLEKDVKQRYQSPSSLLKDLEKIDKFDVGPDDLLASGMSLNKNKSSNKTGMAMFSVFAGLILIAFLAIFKVFFMPPSSQDKAYLKARLAIKTFEPQKTLEFLNNRVQKIDKFLIDYPNAVDANEINRAVEVARKLATLKVFHLTLKKVGNLKEPRSFSFRLFVDGKKHEFTSNEKKKTLYPEARVVFNWSINSEVKMQFEEFEWLDDLIYSARIPDFYSLRALSGSKVYKVKPPHAEYFTDGELHLHYELDEIKESEWQAFDKYFYPGLAW